METVAQEISLLYIASLYSKTLWIFFYTHETKIVLRCYMDQTFPIEVLASNSLLLEKNILALKSILFDTNIAIPFLFLFSVYTVSYSV